MSAGLSSELKQKALALGADLAGLAPAQALPESSSYEKWVAAGMQASMDYMARNAESRKDITHWYPEAKSVLICGFSYAQPDEEKDSQDDRPQGRFARYSVLPDYHERLNGIMDDILEWFKKSSPGGAGRKFVDTSPLLERLYGRYAGLGWVGKNTMLISPKIGSYYLLAGLALNRELSYDKPTPDHCGSCNRCLKACPTDAFPQERVLDAGRCIAYFTIEHRGAIPEEFRPGIGDWVMGCDVCQEVCPWNRFAKPSRTMTPLMPVQQPLEDLAVLDNRGFKERFGTTPVTRTKRKGLVRNALLAMGNSKDPKHRPTLERLSHDPDPIISEQAAWSLKALG